MKRADSRHYLIGVAALRGDGAVVVSRNEGVMVPYSPGHAEARVLEKTGLNPELVVVVRTRRNGDLACAKPCPACELKLKAKGARKVYYSTSAGKLELLV